MILKDLLKEIEYSCMSGSEDVEIGTIVYDSRKIEKDCLFVCVKGANFDGHSAVNEAHEKGAAAVLVMDQVGNFDDMTVIKVQDTRYAMAKISAAWLSYPARKMKIIGITGTKGKTTTTYLIKSILEHAGYKVGLIGTIEIIIGDKHIPALNTTPESYVLQDYFKQMADIGTDIVVMEVSSQGLMMHRTAAIDFEIGIFTNIEPDHIGPNEHSSFEEYMACKSMLFRQCKLGIFNMDDKHVNDIMKDHTCQVVTYGLSDKASLKAEKVEYTNKNGVLGASFKTKGLLEMQAFIDMPGIFSVYNGLCAIAVCMHFNIKPEDINTALLQAKVKGRIEMVEVPGDYTLMIDYAHNAMALESLLTTLKEYNPPRIVCLFGCGGNRSKLRRYEMGEVSGRLADLTVITSDNPRFEEPADIMEDIKTGIEKTSGQYVMIENRKDAIKYCIDNAKTGDVIVLAGKGHEDYQEIKGKKYPMDERVLVKEVLEGK